MSWSERQTELQRERRQAKRKESRALLSDQFCARRGCSNMLYGAQRRTAQVLLGRLPREGLPPTPPGDRPAVAQALPAAGAAAGHLLGADR